MKILPREEGKKVIKYFGNGVFFNNLKTIITDDSSDQNFKENTKSFFSASFIWKTEEEYSNAEFICYQEVENNKKLFNKFLIEEEKHLKFYESLLYTGDVYFLAYAPDRVFFKFESFKEFKEICKIITRDELHMMLVFPEKKIVTRYDWDLRIQVFYYEETGYNFATNLAKELGFYVFE
tara:strand:+ start:744 stop:1280 length:537 start_codon:yes stop_codon:yes gene_type:complete